MPYTGKETRIILSFANADGGDLFAHWLRDRLMKDLDYYSDNAVYLDNVATRDGATIAAYSPSEDLPLSPKPQIISDAIVSSKGEVLDWATKTEDGSYLSIGAQNADWFTMWERALAQARVLIQIQTKPYFDSKACSKEMARIGQTLGKQGSSLRILAITVDGSMARVIINGVGKTEAMKFSKVPGTSDGLSPVSKLKDSWIISQGDFNRVSDFVRANGCKKGQ